MRTTIFVIKFLLLAAFFIISNQNIALIHEENRDLFAEEYKNWLTNVITEAGTLTAYVVKVEWMPQVNEPSSQEPIDKPRFSDVKR